jgi:FHS family glucose/mannose:H+ symporter-like MFS transporter
MKRLTVAGFLAFFLFGFIDNIKGPLLPSLLESGGFSDSQGGTILLVGYIGFILATVSVGVLADLLNNRGVLFLACLCLIIGCSAIGISTTFPILLLAMAVVGYGLGAIELGGNGLMVELHSAERGKYLNLLATFHGLGSLIVPLYAARLLLMEVHWQTIYASCILLVVPVLALFWPRRAGTPSVQIDHAATLQQSVEPEGTHSPASEASWNWTSVLQLAFTRQMAAYYVLLGAYVASELGLAAWMVEFLQRERGVSVGVSSMYLSSFFGLLMIGRLLGAFIVESFGYMRSIAFSLIASAGCLAGGLFGPPEFIFLLPMTGLCMSIVFPTVVAAASDLHESNVGTILGILFAFAGLGGALGPWIIGNVSDYADLQIGLGCCILFCTIALIALGLVTFAKRRP